MGRSDKTTKRDFFVGFMAGLCVFGTVAAVLLVIFFI